MLGGPGVGKTALTQQFLTSEYMAAQNTSFDDAVECTVPVLLDGEEAILEFIDLPYTGDPEVWREYDVEGYIIVYSITDRRSYQKAIDLLNAIRRHRGPHTTLILVANKSDLERSRMVGKQEGKGAAEGYDCKYTEVSAILNHKVDDLLVGTLKQIRLSMDRESKKKKGSVKRAQRQESGDSGCLPRSPNTDSAIRRLIRTARKASKSCENLFAL
ncbi:hypothetical protein CAPTEDRAFT_91481 [Capitella teleta]|uniref:Small monomeric GTPase n=1 Tax=Capitella teleta TaxID=283909 RepID=R7VM96_CAPTE|nr:hypothetical protein CAPTEDRAFT_91481 [Capitella teleta]|eukprot:ELU18455.1 hypothetical protein CAPTEDRAFT_91481 [Capitella teleta]